MHSSARPPSHRAASTSSISGIVVDSAAASIPGATITATNDATAGKYDDTSSANGTFTIPVLMPGKYTVNVALQGFKTAVLKDVAVTAGAPANVRAKLEVGGITETVVVEGATEDHPDAVVGRRVDDQHQPDRATCRSAAATRWTSCTFLPGVQTPGGSRDSIVNGLPQSSINITVDGVSVQDNHLKTGDGFFARMSPRLDAVEEVTVTTAGNGADASAPGRDADSVHDALGQQHCSPAAATTTTRATS